MTDVPPQPTLKKDDTVEVLWGGKWRTATVLASWQEPKPGSSRVREIANLLIEGKQCPRVPVAERVRTN